MRELVSKSNCVNKYLRDTLSRHYDVVYTPAKSEEDPDSGLKSYTMSASEFILDYTDNAGKRRKAANIYVINYGNLEAEVLYSAWLGWREERKDHIIPTLNMDEMYDMMLKQYGSYIEVPVENDTNIRAHNYSFTILDSTQTIVDGCEISEFGEIKYLVDKIDLLKDEVYEDVDNVPVQTEETVVLSEEDWYKYHLGIKSIENDWLSLRESCGITPEQKDEIYQNYAHAMEYETDL